MELLDFKFPFLKHLSLIFFPTLPFFSFRKDPFIMARVSPAASVHLSHHAQIVTHTFILEAVGGEQFRMRVFCVAGSATFKCHRKTLGSTSACFSAVNLLARRWETSI